ncbi:MAG: HdaA/DnaA family protein [Alphaproteobacteria bacterium]
MTGTAQLPLELALRPALGREDFLVAASNQVAVAWIDRWPDWPGPVLALYGPPGCGKTHLCQVWRAASGAVEIDADRLARAEPPELLGTARACVLDDAESLLGAGGAGGGRAEAERLLHLFNSVVERGGQMLLAARAAPARWPCGLADLGSRLAAATAVRLEAPDDALIESLLVKLCVDRQLAVGEDVLHYLLARMERSFAAARALVAALDRASLAEGRAITVPLARRVLEGYETTRE